MNHPTPPSVLIFGMGFVGRALAESLYQHQYPVAAIKRHWSSDDVCLPIEVSCMDLNEHCANADWADYGTWVIALPPAALADYVASMRWLAEQAKKMQVRHIVYLSSVGVFGARQGLCDENTLPEPDTASGRVVLAAEQIWQTSGAAHVDILRLGGLYAAERHPIFALLRQEKPSAQAKQPANRIHRDAAVAAIERAIACPSSVRVRHIVEADYLTKQDFYAREAAKLGVPVPRLADDMPEHSGKRVISCWKDGE